jgi:hypothetical protein
MKTLVARAGRPAKRVALTVALVSGTMAITATVNARAGDLPPLEFGVDRSNMAVEWTLSPPNEPNISPFLSSEYNKPGDFEARRVAVLDGIASIRAQWFRDGFGKGSPDLFVDLVKLVHARHMKMLAVFGAQASDYPAGAYLTKAQSGCQWGTYPLSKINLGAYQKRIEQQFAAVRAVGETVDAFEIGNELDLYCNDADNPTAAEWAKHQWKWFLSPAQVQAFVRGYAPYLAASVASIRKYFPKATIITYGNSMPAAAPLVEALASVRGADGKLTDYTKLVDGYGAHLYPTSTTTLDMVQDATNALRYEAAHYPHVAEKPIWITEWNPAGSSFWNGHPWYFQYNAQGQPGGELNKVDAHRVYKAMDRADAIRTFNRDVVEKLRLSPGAPVNISHIFYYSYDSGAKSPKCAQVKYAALPQLDGFCIDGLIDTTSGHLLPGLAPAVVGK